jgi:hypothetical protein
MRLALADIVAIFEAAEIKSFSNEVIKGRKFVVVEVIMNIVQQRV